MKLFCRIFGHQTKSIVSSEIQSYVANGMWSWPGCITMCFRCGLIWKRYNTEVDPPRM